ncbi:MAG TPA: right-handed parallel beta-helix repeat-containing protein [Thermoanaerobaculia bacterium]|nr:right-handed parallel beta-helix repeat-containing protein [Thermoanaerobaculia bacterium]
MTAKRYLPTFLLGLLSLLFVCAHAEAQSPFTFVSGAGSDANPCTRALPCQTLSRGASQVTIGGEVYVLDALDEDAQFSQMYIFKSLSIIGAGARAGITGILNIAPETGGQVLLKGLDINAPGGNGIQVQTTGITLVVDDCTIKNGVNGIAFVPQGTGTSNLIVRNSIITKNVAGISTGSNAGIFIQPGSGAKAVAMIENVNVNNNNYGIRAYDNSTVTVRNSVSTENVWAGIRSEAVSGGPVAVFVEHSQVSHNGGGGVVAVGATAVLRITDVTITNNATGVNYTTGGIVYSFGNNAIAGNASTLPPTPIPLS